MGVRAQEVEVSVQPGQSPRAVAQAWVQAGVDEPAWLLYQWFKWSGRAREIKAGSYALASGATPRDLLSMLVQGDENLITVRLIEGWTFRRVREALAQSEGLQASTRDLSDADVMARLGLAGMVPEGRFFPDTYAYARGSTDLAVLRRALHAMDRELQAAWAQRQQNLPLTSPEQVLILASIVEKETGLEADRTRVAGVFVNRLRIGMPLQTDPTVIYGLGEAFDGNLKRVHLQTDAPFNTYTRTGLPPTPIAMPGRAALRAAVQPAATRALYFVARGDGSSAFSETLAEHNRAVNQYQRKRSTP